MKEKVLRYGTDGNSVVERNMELQPLTENVYVTLLQKSDWSSARDNFGVVFKLKDLCFISTYLDRCDIEKEGVKQRLQEYCDNWVDNVVSAANAERFIDKLTIAVFERMGFDTSLLYASREKALQRQREEEEAEIKKQQEEEERRKEEERVETLRRTEELKQIKQQFLSGSPIDGTSFLEITKRDGFEIHLRTKGTIKKSVALLDKTGVRRYYKQKGKRMPSFDGCNKAIIGYWEYINRLSGVL